MVLLASFFKTSKCLPTLISREYNIIFGMFQFVFKKMYSVNLIK